MSRCFPFPPPGYEPKARTGIIDLLTKEKHREKKHKKEKRDKEKREHKEKRNKDRSKDKPKEKKDQKHKDKNKEKDLDKGKTSEDIKADGHNELHIKESWQNDETKGSKLFEEELGKRSRDDGAENPTVGNLTNSIQRKFKAVQRRNDECGLPIENVSISQRRAECLISATSKEKERNKMLGCVLSANLLEKETIKIHEKVAVRRGTKESRNQGISQSRESVSGLAIRKTEGSRTGVEKGKCCERSLVSNSVVVPGFERAKLGAKISASSTLTAAEYLFSVHAKIEPVSPTSLPSSLEGMDSVLTIEKGRATGGEMFRVGRVAENLIHKKVLVKNKTQGKQAEDRKGFKDTNHSVKKSKAKDKDILTKEKKKEENIVQNAEGVEHNNLKNFGKKDQAIGTVFIDGNLKKRKHVYTNGYLQENDERPEKMPMMTSSSQSLVNGKSSELHRTAPSTISGAVNNSRPDRLLEIKKKNINGNAAPKNSDVSLAFLPHPDSKYLSQIYDIPKTTELPEIDGRDWLFDCYDTLRKSEIELMAEKIPLVFDEALWIESADF